MTVGEEAGRAPLPGELASWVDAFFERMAQKGIGATDGARRLLTLAIETQLIEGPTDRPELLLKALRRISIDDVASLYALKYGGRRLSFNRLTRLLSDLHEAWLDIKEAEYVQARGLRQDPPAPHGLSRKPGGAAI